MRDLSVSIHAPCTKRDFLDFIGADEYVPVQSMRLAWGATRNLLDGDRPADISIRAHHAGRDISSQEMNSPS
jgi:hypothetical protein